MQIHWNTHAHIHIHIIFELQIETEVITALIALLLVTGICEMVTFVLTYYSLLKKMFKKYDV